MHVRPVSSFLVCPRFLGPRQGFSCHCFRSLVERQEPCRYTSGSAGVAKARTLPHLPSFVACTIRTWSRRTLQLMARQSMAYHSAASPEAAPTARAVVNRVAGPHCWDPALSEPDVRLSPHPAQALRTPLSGRRGFDTERCWR